MKNLRLLTLIVASCLFSLASFAQGFNDFGTYTGTMSDGKVIVIELQANGVATLMIDGNAENVIEFKYNPANSSVIKFKAMPTIMTTGEALPQPIHRRGLFEPINNGQYRLQLGGYGDPVPAQFSTDEIILDFVKD